MIGRWIALAATLMVSVLNAQTYQPSGEKPPMISREFRGAWVAVVHNIDWPSRSGMSAGEQKAEMDALLNKMASLRMNAMLLQVRTQCDAVYASSREPWSPWLTGTMGQAPGYDPLQYAVQQAHARGIEVHAWFNPFRAAANNGHKMCPAHVTQQSPALIKKYGALSWCDPALAETRSRAMNAILDVVKRYDVDGVHLDDYFYPYPEGGRQFNDGRSPAQRRAFVDGFVQDLYSEVKSAKPWVRVGISPFGIWRPGVPAGIEAGVNAVEDLAADSRKWLQNGWVDYLAPQLYWRDLPRKQSFSALLGWWRSQGSRPVWPGIATSRINSSEDPGRPAAEILKQVEYSRRIGQNWVGQIHWSAKSLLQNRGGVSGMLAQGPYHESALVPPMPWLSKNVPPKPSVTANGGGGVVNLSWSGSGGGVAKYAVQARFGNRWQLVKVLPGGSKGMALAAFEGRQADAVAVSAVDRFGNASPPVVLGR